ncbi:Tetratricopeptide repeat-containing protein [Cohaesibacter sp. ES.047]|uniref:tetratricopeptide repeat protein n=1 Tax=Cohaesibacter sp. ES.047 TaxID=1798205 RepID=UPI000BB777D3|nr:tetratricopeptide repeat protein [Cohaesibacter sp. ES.047]SNY94276.1 Tetratricopeptide repeat-containing protein [Cohaesibacter sp. ES.047]
MADPALILKQAQKELHSGRLDKAMSLCEGLLDNQKLFVPTRLLIANALTQKGKVEEAAHFTQEAAHFDPSNVELQVAAGDILERLTRHDEAAPFFQRALGSRPHDPALWRKMLANMLTSARLKAAERETGNNSTQGISIALGAAPPVIPDQVVQLATKALQTFSDNHELVSLVGEIYLAAGQTDAAELCFERSLSARPALFSAHHNWLQIKHEAEKYQDVIDYHKQHEEAIRNNALCQRVVAAAYENLGDDGTALAFLQRAIDLRPNSPEYIGARGRLLIHMGDFGEALKDLEYALAHEPQVASHGNNRRLAHQGLGNVTDAAKDEFYRFELYGSTPVYHFQKPLWTGEPLSGKRLFIWSDEGVGDVFKFGLQLEELPDDCDVIVMSQPKTVEFLKAAILGIEARPLPRRIKKKKPIQHFSGQATSRDINSSSDYVTFEPFEEDFDYQIPLGCLYGHLRPNLQSFKDKARAFKLPAEAIQPYADLELLSDPDITCVGLAWESSAKSPGDARKFLTIEEMLPILTLPGFRFFNFQYSVSETEIDAIREKHDIPLYHAPGLDLFDDMLGTAAFASCMDLFVGPGSTSSDIAGGMGVKCFRTHLVQSPVNLGQDYVPWYLDQKSVRIPWGKSVHDFIPDMKDWLEANKDHRSKNRQA